MRQRFNAALRDPPDSQKIVAGFAELIAQRISALLLESLKAYRASDRAAAAEPDFLTEHAVSNRASIPRRTLQTWRCKGRGPRFVKVGGKILYPRLDLERFLLGTSVVARRLEGRSGRRLSSTHKGTNMKTDST